MILGRGKADQSIPLPRVFATNEVFVYKCLQNKPDQEVREQILGVFRQKSARIRNRCEQMSTFWAVDVGRSVTAGPVNPTRAPEGRRGVPRPGTALSGTCTSHAAEHPSLRPSGGDEHYSTESLQNDFRFRLRCRSRRQARPMFPVDLPILGAAMPTDPSHVRACRFR